MRRIPVRVLVAIVAALTAAWVLTLLYDAVFLIRLGEPRNAMHAPSWLEPYAQSVQMLFGLIPAAILGAISPWRPVMLGFLIGLMTLLAVAILPENRDAIFSSWGMDHALYRSLLWAAGAAMGHYCSQRAMPNTSLERTRDR
jgi:hypothetical protein